MITNIKLHNIATYVNPAKMISRKYLNHTRQDWEEVKYSIMYWVLKVKLSQNYDKFSNALKETETK